ncbi:MAG: RNA polymerase sigma factor [Planctomycetota bacterium]
MEPSDRELAERARRGEAAALALLYRRHKDRLYRHALLHARGRAAVAEEVVQDVFLSLIDGRAAPSENVAGYLLVATRRTTLNRCQRREDRGEPLDPEAAAALVAPRGDGDPLLAADRRERASLLATALLELSPEQREVVLLRTFEGLSWKEVAELLGVPLPTASTRYRAALSRLRDLCRSLSHA